MSFTKKNRFILIVGLGIAAGLALSSAVIGNVYEKNKQEIYTRCVETSANILINDGKTPSNEVFDIAKESCQGYDENNENTSVILAEISIFIAFITILVFMITLVY